MSDLLTRDYGETLRLIYEIIVDPASRPIAALLIYGILVALLIMVLMGVILFITKDSGDEDEELSEVDEESAEEYEAEELTPEPEPETEPEPAKRRLRLPVGLVVLLAIVGWWAATAVMTASTPVCLTCHEQSNHALSQAERDPHEHVRCVRCHDGGDTIVSFTTAVPRRVEHVVTGILKDKPTGDYGTLDRSCESCHASDIARVTTNKARAVKMSHAEPLAAGAECLDCHTVNDGVVGVATTKMQPCLRCHDDKTAPAACSSCHTGDIANAVVGRSEPTTATAEPLVQNIDCGGCHAQDTCDACHGVRLPHTQEFMDHGHARAGVEDLWYNGGRTCGKCHNDTNRPCTSCHKGKFLSHGSTFRTLHTSGTPGGCDTCHAGMAYRNDRDFCELCHSTTE
jgi:nitrate/TMAO reductase-like tetraheme cytochrome c subunit